MAEVFTMPRKIKPLKKFFYEMRDAEDRHINPHALEIDAMDIGHALQKIAACLTDDCVEVQVWRAK